MNNITRYEIEVVPGLEDVSREEIQRLLPGVVVERVKNGQIIVEMLQSPQALLQLRTVIAASHSLTIPVPRPKGLLGHQFFTQIIAAARKVMATDHFRTLSLGVAGDQTTVIERLRRELSTELKLEARQERGDLHIRLRPSVHQTGAWDVLIRLTPRPLATRIWRQHNYPGALSAPVASAMLAILDLKSTDTILNTGCGSGTFLVEAAPYIISALFGVDSDESVLSMAQDHLTSVSSTAMLTQATVKSLPFASQMFSAQVVDLPFGQLIGTRDDLPELYPIWLREAARVAMPGGRLIAITHAITLMESVLQSQYKLWSLERTLRITLNGLHPRIYCLSRNMER